MANHFADIEADGLLHPWEPEAATRIDCMCVLTEDKRAGQPVEWCTEVGKGWMPHEKDYVVFHNGFDYDLPMLQKFWGWEYDIFPDRLRGVHVEFVDTMLLSKLLNPDRSHPEGYAEQWKPAYPGQSLPGPHSLDAWAFRLGMKKPQLVYGDKMGNVPHEISVAQCKADVEITRGVYYALMAEAKQWDLKLRKPLKIEQGVRHIITQGAAHGVWFDTEKAEQCIPDLDAKMAELAERVEPQLPRRSVPASKVKLPPKQKFKKDGTPTALTQKYFGDALHLDTQTEQWMVDTGEPLGAILLKDWPADKPFGDNTEPMTMGNLGDIKQWLMDEHGWKPTIWNMKKGERGKKERTSPKLQQQGKLCEDLQRLGDLVPVVKDIVLWLSYRNRRSVIRSENGTGWLNHPRLALDHCLPADADTMGTGCVTADTLITTDTGLIPIVDVVKGDRVLTHDGTYQRVTDFIYSGFQQIYCVKLSTGNVVKCTHKHPFLSSAGEWVRAEDLSSGDEVQILQEAEDWVEYSRYPSYMFSTWGRVFNKDLGRMLGYSVCTDKLRRLPLYRRGATNIVSQAGVEGRNRGRMLLEAFCGPAPEGQECRHLDGNPSNNFLNNLAWGTSKENTADQMLHGVSEEAWVSRSKLTQEQVEHIRKGPFYRGRDKELAAEYGVSRELVGDIRRGRRYQHYSKKVRRKYKQPFTTAKVESVTLLDKDHVFDITVDNAHSFVGNGVLLHNTFRFTHRVVANIPRKSSVYGEEMRSLFKPPPGKVCVGWDASQLEDRCKAHYCAKMPGGAEYIQKILDPEFDVHNENAENWGMERQKTKNGHYALQYNCRPPKLAETLGIDLETAERYSADWWSRNEPLALLTDEVTAVWHQYGKQWLPALDGRLVPTRKEHALVNTLLQSAGIIAMKWAMVYWWLEVRKRGLDAVQVIAYHDEAVTVCPAEIAEQVGELGVWSIKKAGEALNFRVALESDYKVGESWLDVH